MAKDRAFFLSLKKTGYKGKCVIFVSNVANDVIEKCREMNVELISFRQTGLEMKIHINDFRYYLYLKYLMNNKNNYNMIMLTDLRDLVFQKNPFSYGWSAEKLNVAIEPARVIGTEIYNATWILSKFGNYIFNMLKNKKISCAGTTIGKHEIIEKYLQLMVDTMFIGGYFPSLDQGIHNFLIHTGGIGPVAAYDNEEGPILTLGNETQNIKVDKDYNFLTNSGKVATIIHQYDRNSECVKIVDQLYRK